MKYSYTFRCTGTTCKRIYYWQISHSNTHS